MRIYQNAALTPHSTFTLDEKASHHLSRVLRATIGDALTIFNGQGGEFAAHIVRVNKKNVEVQIDAFIAREVESALTIHLAQGIARGEKMDFIIQKAVELGVKTITPLITERGNVRFDPAREQKRLQHWQAVIISACEQSGRNQLPVIHTPISLSTWLTQLPAAEVRFVLSPHVKETWPTQLTQLQKIAVLIGPEGGLSAAEIVAASAQQFLPLHLGPRVLRTETATIAALTALQCRYGDM